MSTLAPILLATGVASAVVSTPPPIYRVDDLEALPSLPDEVPITAPRRVGWASRGGAIRDVGVFVYAADQGRLRLEDWKHLATTMGLSKLQFDSSIHFVDLFRSDEAEIDGYWYEKLSTDLAYGDKGFLDAWDAALEARRMELAARHRDLTEFFGRLTELELSVEQHRVASLTHRAAARQVRFGTAFPAYGTLRVDPDWYFLLLRTLSFGMTAADAAIADFLLEDWRATADQLAKAIEAASDDFIRQDRTPLHRARIERVLDIADLSDIRSAAARLFDLQDDWMTHASTFVDVVRPVLQEEHATWLEWLTNTESSRMYGALAPIDFGRGTVFAADDPALSTLVETVANVTSEHGREARRLIQEIARIDRRLDQAFFVWIPLRRGSTVDAKDEISRLGVDYVALWQRTVAALRSLFNETTEVPEAVRSAWLLKLDGIAASVEAAASRWATYEYGLRRDEIRDAEARMRAARQHANWPQSAESPGGAQGDER